MTTTPEPTDMGDVARRLNTEMLLRQQYGYLFQHEHDRLQQSIDLLLDRNTNLAATNADLRRQVAHLEVLAQHEQQRTARVSRPRGRVRVIWWVTVWLDAPAKEMGDLLWAERPKLNDQPESGMKVATYEDNDNVLKLVIDYTVVGNAATDIYRDAEPGKKPGMLNRVAKRLGVEILDCEVEEKSRVEAPEFGTEATG